MLPNCFIICRFAFVILESTTHKHFNPRAEHTPDKAIAKLPDSKYDLRYIQAWLNHPYTEKLFQIMGSDFEGGFTARGTYLLKKIPFVELDFNDEKQKALYESVLISTEKINELNIALEQKKDKASINVIEAEKENLSKQIEDNITKIYNLQF